VPEEQEQTEAAAIPPNQILVRAFKGYLYSPITKKLYSIGTREENGPSTFERPSSPSPHSITPPPKPPSGPSPGRAPTGPPSPGTSWSPSRPAASSPKASTCS
jgi:hypothetical protein